MGGPDAGRVAGPGREACDVPQLPEAQRSRGGMFSPRSPTVPRPATEVPDSARADIVVYVTTHGITISAPAVSLCVITRANRPEVGALAVTEVQSGTSQASRSHSSMLQRHLTHARGTAPRVHRRRVRRADSSGSDVSLFAEETQRGEELRNDQRSREAGRQWLV